MTEIKIRSMRNFTKSLPKHDMVIIEGDWNGRVDHNAPAMITINMASETGASMRNAFFAVPKSMSFLLLILPTS